MYFLLPLIIENKKYVRNWGLFVKSFQSEETKKSNFLKNKYKFNIIQEKEKEEILSKC